MKNIPNGIVILGLTALSWLIIALIIKVFLSLAIPSVSFNEEAVQPTNITGVY